MLCVATPTAHGRSSTVQTCWYLAMEHLLDKRPFADKRKGESEASVATQ